MASPSAKHVGYRDYDRTAPLTCPRRDWTRTGAEHEELHRQLMDVSCPKCEQMLLIVTFPNLAETERHARDARRRHERTMVERPA
jgi:hypothetical protein